MRLKRSQERLEELRISDQQKDQSRKTEIETVHGDAAAQLMERNRVIQKLELEKQELEVQVRGSQEKMDELRQAQNIKEQSHKFEIDRANAANMSNLLEIQKLHDDKETLANQSVELHAQVEYSRIQYEQVCSETRDQLNNLSQQKQWDTSSYEMALQDLRDRYTQNEVETSAFFSQGNNTIQELQSNNERLVADLAIAQKFMESQTGQLTFATMQCNSHKEEIDVLTNDAESYKINIESLTTQIVMLNEEAERNAIIMDEVFTNNKNTNELFLEFIKMGARKSNRRDSDTETDERLVDFKISKRAGQAIKLSQLQCSTTNASDALTNLSERDPTSTSTKDSMRNNDTGTGAGFGRERLTTPASGSTSRSGVAFDPNNLVEQPHESNTKVAVSTPTNIENNTFTIQNFSTIRRSHCPSHDDDSLRFTNEVPLKTLSLI